MLVGAAILVLDRWLRPHRALVHLLHLADLELERAVGGVEHDGVRGDLVGGSGIDRLAEEVGCALVVVGHRIGLDHLVLGGPDPASEVGQLFQFCCQLLLLPDLLLLVLLDLLLFPSSLVANLEHVCSLAFAHYR